MTEFISSGKSSIVFDTLATEAQRQLNAPRQPVRS